QNEVAVALWRRVLVDPETAEESVELIGTPHVIVMLQHAEEQRFAHSSRAQEDEITKAGGGALKNGQEGRLVDVEVPFAANLAEVGQSVRDLHGCLVVGGPRRALTQHLLHVHRRPSSRRGVAARRGTTVASEGGRGTPAWRAVSARTSVACSHD